MAGVKTKRGASSKAFSEKLVSVLKKGLQVAGIRRAQIEVTPVPKTRLHRVTVTATGFENLMFSERQDLVWRIVDQEFTPEDQLRISIIMTVSREEAKDTPPF